MRAISPLPVVTRSPAAGRRHFATLAAFGRDLARDFRKMLDDIRRDDLAGQAQRRRDERRESRRRPTCGR